MRTYVLNTPVLTDWGSYRFVQIPLHRVVELLKGGFESAIGHEGTAALMSRLTGIQIPAVRQPIRMVDGDQAVVFRLMNRLPEGAILSEEELEKLDFSFGLLIKEVD